MRRLPKVDQFPLIVSRGQPRAVVVRPILHRCSLPPRPDEPAKHEPSRGDERVAALAVEAPPVQERAPIISFNAKELMVAPKGPHSGTIRVQVD